MNPITPSKPNWKKDVGTSSKLTSKPLKAKKVEISMDIGKTKIPTHNHVITYFPFLGRIHIVSRCPIKRTMITQANREVETNGEGEDKEMPPLKETSGEDFDLAIVDYEAVMVKKALSA